MSAPLFSIIGFGSDMANKGAAVIVPAIRDPERRHGVANIIQERMGDNHDDKKTGAAAFTNVVSTRKSC